jgi:hypothetical protein
MVYPFLPVFSRELGVSPALFSQAIGFRSLAGLASPAFSQLADSRGRKFGMLLGMALAHRELRPTGLSSNLMRWVVVLVLIGVAGMSFIDNAAHAGGLLAGLAAGLWIVRDRDRPLPVGAPLSRIGWIAVGAVTGAPWLWMLWLLVRARLAGG